MILPTMYVSALLLLVVAFLCLGSWANTFKLTGTRWRFELFYIDFAVGALGLSVAAAFTLGTLGSELAFSDRLLVAGRTAQALVVVAGVIFNLGNMLLVASVSLIGVSCAFPLATGLALVVYSLFNFHPDNVLFLLGGIVLMLIAVFLNGSACRLRDLALAKAAAAAKATVPKVPVGNPAYPRNKVAPYRPRVRRATKGLFAAVVSGILLGLFYPVAAKGMTGEFGLGPYAGILLFSLGILVSTIIFNLYFLNIAIEGGPLSFGAYFRGNLKQHILGFCGGALWAGGMLAVALATSVPVQAELNPALEFILPLASVFLVMLWGTLVWKEFAAAPTKAKLALGFTAVLFLGSLVLVAIGITY
jgi:glucose uptake protein